MKISTFVLAFIYVGLWAPFAIFFRCLKIWSILAFSENIVTEIVHEYHRKTL
jgi:hypothetical protein